MGRIQSWSCWFLIKPDFLPLTLPIFIHILPYTFTTIHLCLCSRFYSSMLQPYLLSNTHFVEDNAVFFSLLPSNPTPSLQSFACCWVVYISGHLNTSLGPLLSFQTGTFLCCILPLHFPRIFGVVFLYLTLLCYRCKYLILHDLVTAICIKPWLYHMKVSKSRTN